MSKSVDQKVYTESYYLNKCLGSEEYKRDAGRTLHPRLLKLLSALPTTSRFKVLDVGCGRGDITFYFAQKTALSVGIDYADAAIKVAHKTQQSFSEAVRKKTIFKKMNVKNLAFPDNYFDLIICIDVLEHLYTVEAEEAMAELNRVLKKGGTLFVHTGPNKILYDFIYPWYIQPINVVLTQIDQFIKNEKYLSLPKNPRTQEELEQHVNEPTYFYLHDLFSRHNFSGKIDIEVGFLKIGSGLRTKFYNFLATLYPLSNLFPINIFFGWIFISQQKKK